MVRACPEACKGTLPPALGILSQYGRTLRPRHLRADVAHVEWE